MNLIIDVGNTRVKLAVYEKNRQIYKEVVSKGELLISVEKKINKYPKIDFAIISSVALFSKKEEKELRSLVKLVVLTNKLNIPFLNKYSTPKTLGVDRIALVASASMQFKHENVLVIDAGTCVTFDFINAKNEYLGGAISPGLTIRYEALHNLTAKLPRLKPVDGEFFIGNSTESSIHSGVINGLVNEIDGQIVNYQSNYKDLTVILTGGDTNFLAKRLKSSIFANSNFLLEGLNYILEINKY